MPAPKKGSTYNGGMDTSRSWLIAAAGFLIYFIAMGMNRANGLLFVALLERTGSSRQAASWPFTISGAAVIFVAPLTGFLSNRYSVRSITTLGIAFYAIGSALCFFTTNIYFLSIFFGIIRGSGATMCTTLMPGMINNCFRRHRGTAMGIATTGTPIGALVFPLIIQLCLDEFSLQGTFLLLGAISFHGFLATIVLVQDKPRTKNVEKVLNVIKEEEETVTPLALKSEVQNEKRKSSEIAEVELELLPKTSISVSNGDFPNPAKCSELKANGKTKPGKKMFNKAILKNIFTSRGFYMVSLTQVVSHFAMHVFNLLIVDYMIDKGMELHLAIFMLTSFAVGQIVGRMGLLWITDKGYLSRQTFVVIISILCAGCLFLMVYSTNLPVLLFSGAVLGIAQGTVLPISNVIYAEYLKKEEMHQAVSFTRSFQGVTTLLKTPLIGFFRDQLKSYDYIFMLVAGLSVLSAIAWLCEKIIISRRPRRGSESTNPI